MGDEVNKIRELALTTRRRVAHRAPSATRVYAPKIFSRPAARQRSTFGSWTECRKRVLFKRRLNSDWRDGRCYLKARLEGFVPQQRGTVEGLTRWILRWANGEGKSRARERERDSEGGRKRERKRKREHEGTGIPTRRGTKDEVGQRRLRSSLYKTFHAYAWYVHTYIHTCIRTYMYIQHERIAGRRS